MNSLDSRKSLRKLLSNLLMNICIPTRLIDDITGDLEEEFADRVAATGNNAARNWYLRQATKSALIYLWSQRGDQMILIFALIIFALSVLLILLLSAAIEAFYDFATLMTVIFPAILLGISTTNLSAAKNSLKISLMTELKLDDLTHESASRFLKNTGDLSLMMGFLVCSIQWLGYFSTDSSKSSEELLMSTISVSMLSPIYGLLFKVLCFLGQKKIEFKGSTAIRN